MVDHAVLRNHLTGRITVGIYPLLQGDRCWFLAADFDKSDWRASVAVFRKACNDAEIACTVEISRSGNGAHAWIFFDSPVLAVQARSLGFTMLDKAMERYPQLSFESYERLFPNQDTMPAGGFGNLIALPLQHAPRAHGYSVFVDQTFTPYDDQWGYLSIIQPRPATLLGPLLIQLDYDTKASTSFALDDDRPWETGLPVSNSPVVGCPEHVTLDHSEPGICTGPDLTLSTDCAT
tara:strand:+ start:13649 stop:14353 length:705 start_codon:yes stop_codon:yes gene_type:complete